MNIFQIKNTIKTKIEKENSHNKKNYNEDCQEKIIGKSIFVYFLNLINEK